MCLRDRRCFGVVLQDTALFHMSILENIRYGREDAEDSAVVEAARAAGAHGFISRLPEGYQTLITGGGGSLSQGERQLITIAPVSYTHLDVYKRQSTTRPPTITSLRCWRTRGPRW